MPDNGLVFTIDEIDYPWPTIDSFTMSERRVMYDLCGFVQEDFVQDLDESEEEHELRVRQMMRHPGFQEALMTIAYARGNPSLKPDKVRAVVESTNYIDAIAKNSELAEDDAGPPETSPSEHSNESDIRLVSSSEDSGARSRNGSDGPVSIPEATGDSRSVTSSPA